MRIVIETSGDAVDLIRARDCIDAMLAPRAARGATVEGAAELATLGLSFRVRHVLAAHGVVTVADLCRCTRRDLSHVPDFGKSAMNEVTVALDARGLCLASGTGGRDE